MRTLYFRFYIINGVRRFNLKGNGFAREGLDENLHDGLAMFESEMYDSREVKASIAGVFLPRQYCRPQPPADAQEEKAGMCAMIAYCYLTAIRISLIPCMAKVGAVAKETHLRQKDGQLR